MTASCHSRPPQRQARIGQALQHLAAGVGVQIVAAPHQVADRVRSFPQLEAEAGGEGFDQPLLVLVGGSPRGR